MQFRYFQHHSNQQSIDTSNIIHFRLYIFYIFYTKTNVSDALCEYDKFFNIDNDDNIICI